jgi:hypothetical protein
MKVRSTTLAATFFLTLAVGVFSPAPAPVSASEASAARSYNLVIGGMT